ncbi:MAG TPA: hypothetical protein DCW90_04910 [Lachnospiraceae bacterium]|nr:hypothetical protein [Lachnospiraceae bacterium]
MEDIFDQLIFNISTSVIDTIILPYLSEHQGEMFCEKHKCITPDTDISVYYDLSEYADLFLYLFLNALEKGRYLYEIALCGLYWSSIYEEDINPYIKTIFMIRVFDEIDNRVYSANFMDDDGNVVNHYFLFGIRAMDIYAKWNDNIKNIKDMKKDE